MHSWSGSAEFRRALFSQPARGQHQPPSSSAYSTLSLTWTRPYSIPFSSETYSITLVMSFFSTSQRGYDPVAPPEFPRMPMNSLANFDNLSPHPMQPVPQESVQQSSNHSAQPADRQPITLPKVGQTRCCESTCFVPDDRPSIAEPIPSYARPPKPLTDLYSSLQTGLSCHATSISSIWTLSSRATWGSRQML